MNRMILSGLIVFALLAALFAGMAGQADAQTGTTWTYMVYMSGDSSLSSNIPDDIREMQEVGSGGNLNIIVLADSSGIGDSRLARIIPGGQEEIPLANIDPAWGNELDMGQANTLSEFIIWTAENYPADRYVLDLWGHGTGWVGVCPDKGNYLEASELRTALKDSADAGIHLNMVSMDACQMGMTEMAYEMRGLADYALLSEKDIPLDGWPYDRILSMIKNNANLTVKEFGIRMVDEYMAWGYVNSRYSLTLALIDLAEMERVAGSLDRYSRAALNMTRYYNPQFIRARGLTEEYDGNAQYDIRHLMANIYGQTWNMELKTLGDNSTEALDRAVVYERHWTNVQDEPADHASGLSIWFPGHLPSPDYLRTGFARDTGWDEFLTAMAPYFQNPGREEVPNNVRVTGLDTDDNRLRDAIRIDYDANNAGTTIVELYGPGGGLYNSMVLDTTAAGSQTIELTTFGTYSAAVYLRDDKGILLNYSLFTDGLAREGVSMISGQVSSNTGRGLQWVRVSLLDSRGNVITTTNTDFSGRYRLDVIIPSLTNGSNLVLVCGLGGISENRTIEMLADQNTIDFQLNTANNYIGPFSIAAAGLIVAGLICLTAGLLAGRRKDILEPENAEEYAETPVPETASGGPGPAGEK